MLWRDVANRIGGAATVLLLASFGTFALLALAPGDAAQIVAGENATQEQVEVAREELNLNEPFVLQYITWAWNLLLGDAGVSYVTGRSVFGSIADAFPATLSLAFVTTVLSVVAGLALGAIAGAKQGRAADRLIGVFSTIGLAMPSFWIGLILVTALAIQAQVLPATGYRPLSTGIGNWLQFLLLPSVALASSMTAEIIRQTRAGVSDVLDKPYIRTAKAKGLRTGRLYTQHVARNASIPVVTVLGMQIANLFGGVIVVEQVFGIPGLGTLAVTAVINRDIPLIQGYIIVIAAVVIALNLIVDLSYKLIDPKVSAV